MSYSNEIELMKQLEGNKKIAYDCTAGKRTIGIGFNMESAGARKVWDKLNIQEGFDAVFNKDLELSDASGEQLFAKTWLWCVKQATQRCKVLNIDYDALSKYHKFVLADIAYNTGSVIKWKRVFLETTNEKILFEARRNPKELLDSRVYKIGKFFNIVNSVEEAKNIGIEFAR